MKKLGFLLVAVSMILVGCSNDSSSKEQLSDCKVSVGFVTDMGGIDDRSFNQGSWEGVVKFAEDNDLPKACYTYLESKTEADYVSNLSTLADDGYKLVIAAGYLFEDALKDIHDKYKDTKFVIIDGVVEGDNVQSALFAANESSYLAGMAAALKAKELGSDKVAFMGGMEGPVIGEFQAGFEQGALAANPKAKIYIDYIGGFDDAGKAQSIAEKLYNEGVKVIFHAAGNAGNGVIKEAQTRNEKGEEVFVVGVDKDQYSEGIYGNEEKSVILTSALKKVDHATYVAAKAVMDGNFKPETIKYTIQEDGVGYPEVNPNLGDSIVKALDKAIKEIKEGKIKVNSKATIKAGSTN